jgi:hypothetical protein
MDEAELARIRAQFEQLVRERMPGAPLDRVEVLQYGDDPEIEPGQLLARVVVAAPSEEPERLHAFEAFHDAHRGAFHELRQELDKLPVRVLLQFRASDAPGHEERHGPVLQLMHRAGHGPGPGPEGPGLTPVMARLGAEDLQTLDTLIAAGIAGSRAEAVRWALARIRERPAFEQLSARTRESEQLKSQF